MIFFYENNIAYSGEIGEIFRNRDTLLRNYICLTFYFEETEEKIKEVKNIKFTSNLRV